MKALPTEQVHTAVQIMLTTLSHTDARIPGDMVEGVVSGKSLLRGILNGSLVVCTPDAPQAKKPAAPKSITPEPKSGGGPDSEEEESSGDKPE